MRWLRDIWPPYLRAELAIYKLANEELRKRNENQAATIKSLTGAITRQPGLARELAGFTAAPRKRKKK